MTSLITARKVVVAAPSPLEGEGCWMFQRKEMGEGFSSSDESREETPSPILAALNDHLALSLKGRGRNNAQPAKGES